MRYWIWLIRLCSFYVDDGLFSFAFEKDLMGFFKEIIPHLAARGFQLTKFFTNCENLKKIILEKDLTPV